MGVKSLHVISCVQKVGFKRKSLVTMRKNKSKKYSVIKYKGLEENVSSKFF